MKRAMLVVLVLVLALAVPANAVAAKRSYSGELDAASGSIGFKLKKRKGKVKVKDFRFKQVPIACDEGATTTRGHLDFDLRARKRRFKGRAENDAGGKLRIAGRLTGGLERAHGTIRVFGSVRIPGGGTGTNCATGELDWNARRD